MALDTHSRTLPAARLRARGRSVARRTFASLEYPEYRAFWFSLVLMMAGINMQMLARGQLAWELTGDNFFVALVGAGFAPPVLLFSIFGGVLADSWDRKRMVQYGQLVVAVIAAGVGISIQTDTISVWILLVAALAQGTVWSFMMPARQSLIPELVPKPQLTNAIALSASGMSLMTLTGPGLGGLSYAILGPGPTYFVIAVLNLAAFALMRGVPNVQNASPGGRRPSEVLAAAGDGLRYALRNRTILFLLLLLVATTMSSMSFRSLMPAYADDVLGGGAQLLGVMMSMIGLGALFGTLFVASLSTTIRRGLVLLAATGLSAIAILVSSVVSIALIAGAAMTVLGLGDAGRRSLNASLLMEQSDEAHRGRVMGIYMMNFGLTPLAAIPLGILAEQTSLQVAFAVAGGVLATAVLAGTVGTRRLRGL